MSDTLSPPEMARYRTALARYGHSQPVRLLVRHGLIRPGVRAFDYGCGQGDDLRALSAVGIAASGWDPHFAPIAPREKSDVVNLGFVLNVIEDPAGRREALRTAWSMTESVLAVATMVEGRVPLTGLKAFRDGQVTSRGTFQKYYQHAELRRYVFEVTGADPVSLVPGIFFAFRRPEDEQDFLLERRRGALRPLLEFTAGVKSVIVPQALPSRIPTAFGEIVGFALRRGRYPQLDEVGATACAELANARVSLARAVDACRTSATHEAALAEAVSVRREDLLVHHALGILNKTRSSASPSQAMVRGVKALFGAQRNLQEEATRYLYALGDAVELSALCVESPKRGLGAIDARGRLVIDVRRLDLLPGPLRAYVGCAAHLHGEPTRPFLVSLDPARRRVKYMDVTDERARFPVVTGGSSIDLKRCSVFENSKQKRLMRKGDVYGTTTRKRSRLRSGVAGGSGPSAGHAVRGARAAGPDQDLTFSSCPPGRRAAHPTSRQLTASILRELTVVLRPTHAIE